MKQLLTSLWFGTLAGLREMRVQPLRSALSMTGVGLAIAAVTAISFVAFGWERAEPLAGPGGEGRDDRP